MKDVYDMAYDSRGRILIGFDAEGLERLMDALNDNQRGEFFGLIQLGPGAADIVQSKLSWAQRLYSVALREENKN